MKLYKITAPHCSTKWAGSQSDANKTKGDFWTALKQIGGKRNEIHITPVDVDTKKEGLIAFLNQQGFNTPT